MNKFTPGPWVIEPTDDEDSGCVAISAADPLNWTQFANVVVRFDGDNRDSPEGLANAALIAAAPELLAALEGVLRVADRATVEFDAARTAIAKAKP